MGCEEGFLALGWKGHREDLAREQSRMTGHSDSLFSLADYDPGLAPVYLCVHAGVELEGGRKIAGRLHSPSPFAHIVSQPESAARIALLTDDLIIRWLVYRCLRGRVLFSDSIRSIWALYGPKTGASLGTFSVYGKGTADSSAFRIVQYPWPSSRSIWRMLLPSM